MLILEDENVKKMIKTTPCIAQCPILRVCLTESPCTVVIRLKHFFLMFGNNVYKYLKLKIYKCSVVSEFES